MASRRSRLLAVAAAVGALLLAGCAGIPSSGPVRVGEQVRADRTEPFTRVLPASPAKGASPLEIVNGFLTANASSDNDFAVARSYLTADAGRAWNPGAGAVVYPSTAYQTSASPGTVEFTTTPTATIGAHGEFTSMPIANPYLVAFGLTRVSSEWRISVPQKGLLLTDLDVDRGLRYFNVYFPDPDRLTLVPSPVLLPAGPGTSTALVRALLAGPPTWLAPAVRSAFPAGTTLVVDSAPVTDGVVQVDLSSPAAALSNEEASALAAQLTWTLRQLPEVNYVRITVEGVPVRGGGAGATQSVDAWPQFDPDGLSSLASGYFSRTGRIQAILTKGATPIAGPAGDGRVPLVRPAVSLDGAQVAGLDATGHTLLAGPVGATEKVSELLKGGSLTTPSWDRSGAVWTVDSSGEDATPKIWAVVPGSPRALVATDGSLPKGRVLSLRIARDGVRAAVVVRGPQATNVFAAIIVRQDGRPRLQGFRLVPTPLTSVSDAVWADADRLLVVGRSSSGLIQPALVDLTRPGTQVLGPVTGSSAGSTIVAIGAGPSHPTLIGTSDGKVWTSSGSGWDPIGDGRDPVYPG